jgi:hypothetical protein
MIIGVCGKKRHGKDTVGRILVEKFGFQQTAFADAVKRVAMDVWGLSWTQCYGTELDKETVIPKWGMSPREILQKLGTEVGRNIYSDTWIVHCLDNIRSSEEGSIFTFRDDSNKTFTKVVGSRVKVPRNWVITDVRFPNEAEAIRRAGGAIWKVQRDLPSTDSHASETSMDQIVPDVLIDNNSSLEDLQTKVMSLVLHADLM